MVTQSTFREIGPQGFRGVQVDMIHHILVPLDGSAHSEMALAFASLLARLSGARLSLLTVVLPFDELPSSRRKVEKASQSQIREYLHPLRDRLLQEGLNVSTHVDFGDPAEAIVDFARQESADLIAMCSQRVAGGNTMGSTAVKVLLSAPCPVTIIK